MKHNANCLRTYNATYGDLDAGPSPENIAEAVKKPEITKCYVLMQQLLDAVEIGALNFTETFIAKTGVSQDLYGEKLPDATPELQAYSAWLIDMAKDTEVSVLETLAALVPSLRLYVSIGTALKASRPVDVPWGETPIYGAFIEQ